MYGETQDANNKRIIFLVVIAYKNKNLTKNICCLGSSLGLWAETCASKPTGSQ